MKYFVLHLMTVTWGLYILFCLSVKTQVSLIKEIYICLNKLRNQRLYVSEEH